MLDQQFLNLQINASKLVPRAPKSVCTVCVGRCYAGEENDGGHDDGDEDANDDGGMSRPKQGC